MALIKSSNVDPMVHMCLLTINLKVISYVLRFTKRNQASEFGPNVLPAHHDRWRDRYIRLTCKLRDWRMNGVIHMSRNSKNHYNVQQCSVRCAWETAGFVGRKLMHHHENAPFHKPYIENDFLTNNLTKTLGNHCNSRI